MQIKAVMKITHWMWESGGEAYVPQHDGPSDILCARWGGEGAHVSTIVAVWFQELNFPNVVLHVGLLI